MRYHLLNNDIKLFLENSVDVFDKKIKTRVKDWRTVTLNTSHNADFLQLLLIDSMYSHKHVESYDWPTIFQKLEQLNFTFKASHYFAKILLNPSLDNDINSYNDLNYLSYINELKKRNISPYIEEMKYFISNQRTGVNEQILNVFREHIPEINAYILDEQVNNAVISFIDENEEMFNAANSHINGIARLLVNMVGNNRQYKQEQDIKRKIILDYLELPNISKERAMEIIKMFRPKASGVFYEFLQAHDKRDMLSYIQKMLGEHEIKKNWYTVEQLSLIHVIENKFGIAYLDNLK
jgi:hypothetical protein